MYYNSTGTAQGMRFTNCKFTNFTQLFNVPTAISGAANASENTFFNCKFENFEVVIEILVELIEEISMLLKFKTNIMTSNL